MVGWTKIIQPPVEGEPCHFGKHVELMDPVSWQPKQVTYHSSNGSSMRAVAQDTAKACCADWITLSNYRLPIVCPDVADKNVVDLDKVATPPTPPMGANILWLTTTRQGSSAAGAAAAGVQYG